MHPPRASSHPTQAHARTHTHTHARPPTTPTHTRTRRTSICSWNERGLVCVIAQLSATVNLDMAGESCVFKRIFLWLLSRQTPETLSARSYPRQEASIRVFLRIFEVENVYQAFSECEKWTKTSVSRSFHFSSTGKGGHPSTTSTLML